MNNKMSFVLGWGGFFFCTLGGAAMGIRRFQGEHVIRVEEDKVRKVEMRKELERIQAKKDARKAAIAGGGGGGGG
eukprot:CAMPEP_0119527188 /NCGR_PEP_ID=MMETSP1344-20130328/41659_1 /TAXON_ID=236787 /ORGANISM="Florenciella parvula, Strain CCMP2471" /LENGTH=74 /DNA_ID=CAMNT_0007566347 /DNA_START=245 /DNA_END=465 /DNA_ORIENTATION=-